MIGLPVFGFGLRFVVLILFCLGLGVVSEFMSDRYSKELAWNVIACVGWFE